jgi:putative DNA primase/helicase
VEDPVDTLLARLERVRKQGSGFTALCPAHSDRNPSLSVIRGDDGRVLVRCHAGCTVEEVTAAVGLELRDLFPQDRNSSNGARTLAATYDYADAAGTLLYQAVRFTPKGFAQRRPTGDGAWTWRLGDVQRVLYRLPAVLDAAAIGGTVYLVEGEKDVHALERLGVVATCNPMGAGKWRADYAEALRGASRVVVIADDDRAGRDHAAQVARSIFAVVADVRVMELWPRGETGADVADWVAVAKDETQLAQASRLLEEIVDRTPPIAEGSEPAAPFALRLDEFVAATTDTPPTLIGDEREALLPAAGLLILFAKGGKGKTTLTLDAAFHFASGVDWLGFAVPRPLRVLLIENEGPREPFRTKLELKKKLWPHPISGEIHGTTVDWGAVTLKNTVHAQALRDYVVDYEIDLVVGDPLDSLGLDGVGSPEGHPRVHAAARQHRPVPRRRLVATRAPT